MQLISNYRVWLAADKIFYFRLTVEKMPYLSINVNDHTAEVALILRLWLPVQIQKLKCKVKSMKCKSCNTNLLYNKKNISPLLLVCLQLIGLVIKYRLLRLLQLKINRKCIKVQKSINKKTLTLDFWYLLFLLIFVVGLYSNFTSSHEECSVKQRCFYSCQKL